MSDLKYILFYSFICFFLIVLSFACRTPHKHSITALTDKSSLVDTFKTQTADSLLIKAVPVNGKFNLFITKKAHQKIYIQFNSIGYTKLSARLVTCDRNANIRFCQIFLPDGTMDGPFTQQLSYQLSNNGVYKLSIGESLMAGEPWAGSFHVFVKLY